MSNACPAHLEYEVYEPRNPHASDYYQCIEAHFEDLEGAWEEHYQPVYGYWRPYIMDVILRYLDCGDLHFGFARVRCETCGHEYLLAFSCKRRHFCPSCHQKRVVEFGEWLYTEVLKEVPHRQWVFSIPKRLRIYFMFDRSLLAELSQCAWRVLSAYLKHGSPYDDAIPGAVIAIQSFGDFLNFHPHTHIIASDGCFGIDGKFIVSPAPNPKDLENAFRNEVFKMLKKNGKITDFVIENMMNWHHSGFNVYCGESISPSNKEGIEKLAQYIIRAPISQERMIYIPANKSNDGNAKVIYESKDGKTTKTFDALDWLAQLVTHIPNKGEQMVRYYGYYSNRLRGTRKKEGKDDQIPALVNSDISKKEFRKNWARLIQKIYHIDPFLCPKCSGQMRIIGFIETPELIKKILKHIGLWDSPKNHSPPKNEGNYMEELADIDKSYADNYPNDDYPQVSYDDDYSQVPPVDCVSDW